MRHGVKKIKFGKGKNKTVGLIRKLSVNFLQRGKLTTTLKRAKVLKSVVEKLVEKAKKKSEANKNMLLRYLADWDLVARMFSHVGPVFIKRTGGYVRLVRLGVTSTDGIVRARMEWTSPVILSTEKVETNKTEKNSKNQVKEAKTSSKK